MRVLFEIELQSAGAALPGDGANIPEAGGAGAFVPDQSAVDSIMSREFRSYEPEIRVLFEPTYCEVGGGASPYQYRHLPPDMTRPRVGSVAAVFSTIGTNYVGNYSYNYKNEISVPPRETDTPTTGPSAIRRSSNTHVYDPTPGAALILLSYVEKPVLLFVRPRSTEPFTFCGLVRNAICMPDGRVVMFVEDTPFNGVHAGTVVGKKSDGRNYAPIIAPRFGFQSLNNRRKGATHFVHAREPVKSMRLMRGVAAGRAARKTRRMSPSQPARRHWGAISIRKIIF